VAASDGPLQLVGERASVDAAVRTPKTRTTLQIAVDDSGGGKHIYLTIDNITADANPGTVYAVFLNLPDDATGDDAEPYYVGNLSLFGIEEMNEPDDEHQHAPGLDHAFEVTEHVGRLQAENRWDPDQITVTFEPILPLPPPVEPSTRQTREVAAAGEKLVDDAAERYRRAGAATPISVGRVGLFVEGAA